MKIKKTVIFDLDGTLFRTETVDIVAINKALEWNGFEKESPVVILDCIGLTLDEMCEKFGIRGVEVKNKFKKDLINFEQEEIERFGMMYDGAPELIMRLKAKGYTLCICSNGSKDYVYKVLDKFGLIEYFDEIWAHTDGYTKSQAVASLADRYAKDGFIMVGDRSSDINAGIENSGITIGMLHGFGGNEPFAADYTAGSIAELEKVILAIHQRRNDFVKENELCVE